MTRQRIAPASGIPKIWNAFPCFDLVDTEFADHTGAARVFDRLAMPGWQRAFLEHWGWRAPLPAPPADLGALLELRGRVRQFLEDAGAARPVAAAELAYLNRVLAAAPFVNAIGEDGQFLAVPLGQGWKFVLAGIVSSAMVAIGRDARRIKKCANPDCSWLFYDETLNRSRRWCQVNYCGNLVKVRAHRARRKPEPVQSG